ncbi:MAG TPA: methyltransferase domain-containing protein [Streptosporangiaceae bacterium]
MTDVPGSARLFDRVASSYDDVLPFFAEFGRITAAALPGPAEGGRLLDIGAGRGALAIPAAAAGYLVTAVDAAPGMVARLTAEQPGLDARLMDASSLGFADATFDVVTAAFVLHLLPGPAAALAEIARVLTPGGLLAFTVPGPLPPGFEHADNANELFAEFSRHIGPASQVAAPFEEIPAMTAAGFRDIERAAIQVELPVPDPDTFWRWLLSHGSRQFLDGLGDARRAEFRARLVADLLGRDGLVLRRHAWLYRGRSSPARPPAAASIV